MKLEEISATLKTRNGSQVLHDGPSSPAYQSLVATILKMLSTVSTYTMAAVFICKHRRTGA